MTPGFLLCPYIIYVGAGAMPMSAGFRNPGASHSITALANDSEHPLRLFKTTHKLDRNFKNLSKLPPRSRAALPKIRRIYLLF